MATECTCDDLSSSPHPNRPLPFSRLYFLRAPSSFGFLLFFPCPSLAPCPRHPRSGVLLRSLVFLLFSGSFPLVRTRFFFPLIVSFSSGPPLLPAPSPLPLSPFGSFPHTSATSPLLANFRVPFVFASALSFRALRFHSPQCFLARPRPRLPGPVPPRRPLDLFLLRARCLCAYLLIRYSVSRSFSNPQRFHPRVRAALPRGTKIPGEKWTFACLYAGCRFCEPSPNTERLERYIVRARAVSAGILETMREINSSARTYLTSLRRNWESSVLAIFTRNACQSYRMLLLNKHLTEGTFPENSVSTEARRGVQLRRGKKPY